MSFSLKKWWTGFEEKSRQHEIEIKVNSLLKSITEDSINQFTHDEQSQLVVLLVERFKDKKSRERQDAMNLANEITISLKRLK